MTWICTNRREEAIRGDVTTCIESAIMRMKTDPNAAAVRRDRVSRRASAHFLPHLSSFLSAFLFAIPHIVLVILGVLFIPSRISLISASPGIRSVHSMLRDMTLMYCFFIPTLLNYNSFCIYVFARKRAFCWPGWCKN